MSIDFHTQTLRIEVERVKKQKLSSTLKKVKREMIMHHQLLSQVHYDTYVHHKEIQDLKIKHDDELARLRSLIYCGFSRLHQLLIAVTPYIPMPSNDHVYSSQLLYEYLKTIEQIKLTTDVSNSSGL